MRKIVTTTLILFLVAFSLFFVWVAITPADFAMSVIPGWHTTVLPPHFFLSFFITPWLLFTALIYLWAFIKKWSLNKLLVIIHVLLSIPLLIVFLYKTNIYLNFYTENTGMVFKAFFLSTVAFVIAQIFFMLQLITTYKKLKTRH
ncbi:hypothetical protein GN157_04490 [Flavobacterium rakeshii]|uniref:Uncharacterized protein n=1 Tax=Flavobacterium rakeshii TaxID=1038845 RepID=A0A6N8H8Y1_9FLAO|nr:hypothetical protein [Flavobacterium rakeshii]MEE1898404.1 hypothetical protein [Flavobacterium rakeshii]MUV02961.1 hypothetical protein [Flavobacterium rakeshii]